MVFFIVNKIPATNHLQTKEKRIQKMNTKTEKSILKLKAELKRDVAVTEEVLKDHPNVLKRLEKYLYTLKTKSNTVCSVCWLEYQIDRLKRIQWLFDKNDNGKKSGMRLKMRPYDIPWTIYVIGVMEDKSSDTYKRNSGKNGCIENVEKILNCPDMEIEFTEKFADFCYLCRKMTCDGCPQFPDYGKVFPQPVQLTPKLREDCELSLKPLDLKWSDVVTAKELLDLCVEKASDPSVFYTGSGFNQNTWGHYRLGIEKIKKWQKKHSSPKTN